MFLRNQTRDLISRLGRPGPLLQILTGPRQVGKTTAIRQILDALGKKGCSKIFATADAIAAPPVKWISEHWDKAAARARAGKPAILAFDELQKIPGWSEIVKKRVDQDSRKPPARRPRVILSGSSALMIERGLTESLAGRFELIRFPHWNLAEMREAFGTGLQKYLVLGGYPKLREFRSEPERFLEYVKDSIIEPVLSKDILLLHPVNKPALLRRLFEFACYHPAEMVSLQKMLGQLTDKGNVTTIADYLNLLGKAYLVVPIQKYSPEILRIRGSSPKLIVMAQALVSAVRDIGQAELSGSPKLYGRLAENAVGAHLLKAGLDLYYWRDRDEEIDFIVRKGGKTAAIEVGTSTDKTAGTLRRLAARLNIGNTYIVGPAGIPLEEFLSGSPEQLL